MFAIIAEVTTPFRVAIRTAKGALSLIASASICQSVTAGTNECHWEVSHRGMFVCIFRMLVTNLQQHDALSLSAGPAQVFQASKLQIIRSHHRDCLFLFALVHLRLSTLTPLQRLWNRIVETIPPPPPLLILCIGKNKDNFHYFSF